MTLPASFFARDAETVAKDLLGTTLVHGAARCRVTETEAYVGPHDMACHARVGVTPRTRVLYGPPGRAYVYLCYGIHHLLNVVTGDDGDGQAVLIRAAEPIAGIDGRTDGPGRLTRALGIRVEEHNDVPLDGKLRLETGGAPRRVLATPRIGVAYAGDWAAAPLRFLDADSRHVTPTPKTRGEAAVSC